MSIVLVCKHCVDTNQGYFQPELEHYEDGSAVQRCPNCKSVVVIYLNQGKLDLGLIEQDQNADDFEVFA